MKKMIFVCIILWIVIYPPHFSTAERDQQQETAQETELHYQMVKNEVLKFQIQAKLDTIHQLCKFLKIKK